MNIFKKVSNRQEYLVDWLCRCFHTKFNQVTRERLEGCPLGTVCIYPKDLSITPDYLMQAFIDLNKDIDVAYCMTLASRKFINEVGALDKWTCMLSRDIIYVSNNPDYRGRIEVHLKIKHGVERILKGETDYIDLSDYEPFSFYKVRTVEYAHSLLPNIMQKLYEPKDLFWYGGQESKGRAAGI